MTDKSASGFTLNGVNDSADDAATYLGHAHAVLCAVSAAAHNALTDKLIVAGIETAATLMFVAGRQLEEEVSQ